MAQPALLCESEIRAAVHGQIRRGAEFSADALVIDECRLWMGDARVDVVVVDQHLHGFEIKSERDGLSRLRRQIEVYSSYLERITLVTAGCHVRKAEAVLPSFWGMTVAVRVPNGMRLEVVRPAHANPCLDVAALARVLWRREALACLRERGLVAGRASWSHRHLCREVATVVPLDELAALVRACLRCRSGRGDVQCVGAPADDLAR